MSNTALSDELHSNLHNTPTLHNSERICALLELKQKKKKEEEVFIVQQFHTGSPQQVARQGVPSKPKTTKQGNSGLLRFKK